ncbi:hypothetical protein LARV_01835 [Longilinea arvoryzae]|uniref:Mannosylglycerate hydrolase MGH1-like glycoside hydrolase domain-containing protein n=1 Tax=Longilinea arvoryzae TaxID=360412 RepID=A0A0S7BF11_9CHLR|nr:hypothetical protein [Longilinea arvoryzae]GAP14073.1 hypothetical protein LARV_01835 [Longilinea arvoryzae]
MSVENGSTPPTGRYTLAADVRFSQPDYVNDISWEFSTRKGEAFPFSLNTTFGLRALSMRMFPRLVRAEIGPNHNTQPGLNLRILGCYPNFLRLVCQPLAGVELMAEFWVPSSHVISGKLTLTNRSVLNQQLRFDWAALLTPMDQGHGMAALPMGKTYVLEGQTRDLYPVCFLTGGPKPGPSSFPTLGYDIDLYPGSNVRYVWALAALGNPETSLDLAQATANRDWDPEIARLELLNTSQTLKVITGNANWNAAFASAQRTAFQLFFPAGADFPASSFVQQRNPDNGFSMRGDGTDYNPRWSGQTALDAWYLNNLILPTAPDLAAGVIDNFLAVQEANGEIDWKPGLGGQRVHMLTQPLLATISWKIHASHPDKAWLEKIFPELLRFFEAWFSPAHDQDGDGYPEWNHRAQTGLDDHPLFDRWQPANQGVNPTDVETPVLAAMLYREAHSLISIAAFVGREDAIEGLQRRARNLAEQVETTWDQLENTYTYRDMLTGQRPRGANLLLFHGSGKHDLRQNLETPQKLLLSLYGDSSQTRKATFSICGHVNGNPVQEAILPGQIHWMNHTGHAVTQSRFTSVEEIEIRGLPESDHGLLRTADLTRKDISLLLPLWANIPSQDRALQLIQETILPQFRQAFGLPVCPSSHLLPDQQHLNRVFLPWNQFILEGLLAYGFQETAADLFTRIMNGICQNLELDGHFHEFFSAANGKSGGDIDTLASLPPLGLFLQILGLRNLSDHEIILQGLNPFPWPVTVQYRGILLSFFADRTEVKSANGFNTTLNTPDPQRIILT